MSGDTKVVSEGSDLITPTDHTAHHSNVKVATIANQMGSPTALGIGLFAVTFTTLSMGTMEWRGVEVLQAFIGNCFYTAGWGLVIVSAWEMAAGNTYGSTVFGGFAFFNLSYGAVQAPEYGVTAAYGDDLVAMNNALGYYLLVWGIFVTFFTIAALPMNFVYINMLGFSALAYYFLAGANFARADGNANAARGLKLSAGAAAFVASLFAWYTLGHLMCQDALCFSFPMGDTSRLYKKSKASYSKSDRSDQSDQV